LFEALVVQTIDLLQDRVCKQIKPKLSSGFSSPLKFYGCVSTGYLRNIPGCVTVVRLVGVATLRGTTISRASERHHSSWRFKNSRHDSTDVAGKPSFANDSDVRASLNAYQYLGNPRLDQHLFFTTKHQESQSRLPSKFMAHTSYTKTSRDMCTLPLSPQISTSGYFNPCKLFIYASFLTATSSVGTTEAPISLLALFVSLAATLNFIYLFLFWPGNTVFQPPPEFQSLHGW
jgi:hypothetical protein